MEQNGRLIPGYLDGITGVYQTPMTSLADSQESVNYVERSWNGSEVVETTKPCTDYELLHSTNSCCYTIGQDNEET